MSSLRIHFLTPSIQETGTYFRIHNLAVGLTRLGQKITVFSADYRPSARDREEVRDGVLYRISASLSWSFSLAVNHPINALKRCFIDYPQCDVAHLFQPFLSATLPWQLILAKKAKVLFYDWDDLWEYGEKALLGNPTNLSSYVNSLLIIRNQNYAPRKAKHVTTCSHFLANLAKKKHAKHVSVIHNGFWSYEIPDKTLARQSLGLDTEAIYVGFMGSTGNEIPWCFEALERNLSQYNNLRFAICGRSPHILEGLSEVVLQRIDFLGTLSYTKSREFSAALDLGLLPLEDNSFNQSRLPIKYAEYMAAGIPILCSEIGECERLSEGLPWVIGAGKDKSGWLNSFQKAINLIDSDRIPKVDFNRLNSFLSWEAISKKLLEAYYAELDS